MIHVILIAKKVVPLQQKTKIYEQTTTNDIRGAYLIRSGYSTINNFSGLLLLPMAGHVITLYRGALKEPVDYKGGEHPQSCETGVFTKSVGTFSRFFPFNNICFLESSKNLLLL